MTGQSKFFSEEHFDRKPDSENLGLESAIREIDELDRKAQEYVVPPEITTEVEQFIRDTDNAPNLEEWKRLTKAFDEKAKANTAYRLAYLEKKNPNPKGVVFTEINTLRRNLANEVKKTEQLSAIPN